MQIAVTGSTGEVGGRVARRLAAAGVPQRLIVRDATRAPSLDRTEVRTASYGDGDAVKRALDGVDSVFMVSAAENAERVAEHVSFVDAAVAAGVRRIVYTSFYGAAPDCTFTLGRDHWATEERIRASGLAFTFLRDNLYLDFLPIYAGEAGVIRGPAGDGRLSAVARDDVADVATAVLQQDGHDGASYDLTGPEALSMAEAAARMTEALGRPVRYQPETVEEAYASRAGYNAPTWLLDAWVSTYTAIAAGELDGVSPDVERITGHPPRTLEAVLG